jgi:hypothetical protein
MRKTLFIKNCLFLIIATLLVSGAFAGYANAQNRPLWSETAGAREQHLIRRYQSPYFDKSRRVIAQEELQEAKRLDRLGYETCLSRFKKLQTAVTALPRPLELGAFMIVREPLQDLNFYCIAVGGRADGIGRQSLAMYLRLIQELKITYEDQPNTLNSINLANDFHLAEVQRYAIPFLQQFLGKGGAIPAEDLIPGLLSESAYTLQQVLDVIPPNIKPMVVLQLLEDFRAAYEAGYRDPEGLQKIGLLTLNDE